MFLQAHTLNDFSLSLSLSRAIFLLITFAWSHFLLLVKNERQAPWAALDAVKIVIECYK